MVVFAADGGNDLFARMIGNKAACRAKDFAKRIDSGIEKFGDVVKAAKLTFQE